MEGTTANTGGQAMQLGLARSDHRLPGVLELTPAQWEQWLAERGQPAMRWRQIRKWLLHTAVSDFAEMTDLPRVLRQVLVQHFCLFSSDVAKHLAAPDDTHKLLLNLAAGGQIECVLIQEQGRRTGCISTQVGCGMGCVFCASGLNGVDRNLTVAEIVEQVLHLQRLPPAEIRSASDAGRSIHRLTHIVVMGMGEPLANLDRLLEALEIITSDDGVGMSARHVTISTVGLPKKIRQLADNGRPYNLAISLHAPNDRLRTRIVPTNEGTGIDAILDAADYYTLQTGRQVTYEYVLLGGINDRVQHARELCRLLRGRLAHVNLIPYNEVTGLPYRRPSQFALSRFIETLRHGGLSVKVRKRKGSQIAAACGQLRRTVLPTQASDGIS